MQRKLFKRMLAFVVACAMIISLVPMTADAAFESETHERFKKTTSTIAPGVTQDVCFAYAKADGKQMAYYIATADINRDDVHVYANYKDNQCEVFGLQKLRDQLAAAQAKHSNPADSENYIENYTVVAGVNGDFYNMSTGKPTYAFAMEGKVVNKANGSSFFAIREDGKAVIGFNDADWESLNAESKIMEAVGGNSILVRDGKDVTLVATGLLVGEALKAADILSDEGISARVINIHNIKPIDKDIIVKAALETGALVTCEEHNVIGGLGSAVAEVLCENAPAPLMRIGTQDKFGKSGKPDELLKEYGLTAEAIVKSAHASIELKK